ncbi:hypothetical protein [Streptomyces sp. NPDC086787]|uniref:hypothetical protein n=1 Tax=Streptomyces sp. NPDC086787 TaxID=3365759 RepID=UPI003815265B
MTSASATTRVRITATAAAGLAGVLALTACSGGSTDDSSSGPSTSASAAPSAGGGGTGGVTSSSGSLQGSWLATTDGKAVALVVTDKRAALFETGGTVCSGTAGEESGMQMIHLTCTDGNKDRGTGMVGPVSKTEMKVTWSGKAGQETYTKAEGGKLPSGLPTAGLGS